MCAATTRPDPHLTSGVGIGHVHLLPHLLDFSFLHPIYANISTPSLLPLLVSLLPPCVAGDAFALGQLAPHGVGGTLVSLLVVLLDDAVRQDALTPVRSPQILAQQRLEELLLRENLTTEEFNHMRTLISIV